MPIIRILIGAATNMLIISDDVNFSGQVSNKAVWTWRTPREEAGLVGHADLVNYLGIVELEAGTIHGSLKWSSGL